eukprot:TRINITY_DN9416_c0_g2_i1.p1 TRINITY_DN9416_c0_g2~~TRINITY_DN9416_c0_g2_i1.p1  ORF type:complete len:318 (-),score=60.67 TRINITY_DN9416_c0_g2_i1:58-1011(-)
MQTFDLCSLIKSAPVDPLYYMEQALEAKNKMKAAEKNLAEIDALVRHCELKGYKMTKSVIFKLKQAIAKIRKSEQDSLEKASTQYHENRQMAKDVTTMLEDNSAKIYITHMGNIYTTTDRNLSRAVATVQERAGRDFIITKFVQKSEGKTLVIGQDDWDLIFLDSRPGDTYHFQTEVKENSATGPRRTEEEIDHFPQNPSGRAILTRARNECSPPVAKKRKRESFSPNDRYAGSDDRYPSSNNGYYSSNGGYSGGYFGSNSEYSGSNTGYSGPNDGNFGSMRRNFSSHGGKEGNIGPNGGNRTSRRKGGNRQFGQKG